jgi:hypothetical protein
MDKKGQSALEYLMTYGWALVVIVIVIAALVFLIQPSQVGGNTCSTTSGILITNHAVSSTGSGGLTMALSNQTATSLTDVGVGVSGVVGSSPVSDSNTISTLGTVSQQSFVDITPAVASGATYSLQVTFTYNDRDNFPRTVTSTCNGTAS